MQFAFRYPKTFLIQEGIKIETKEGIYTYGEEGEGSDAAGVLLKMCLLAHASAVVFTKYAGFYPYIESVAPNWLADFKPKGMFQDTDYPWILGFSEAAIEAMVRVFTEARLERSLIYLKGKRKGGPPFPKPSLAQCFYQITDTGSKKDRILTEALFTGLLTEAVSREGVRETLYFYDAPYHPQTIAAIETIRKASDEGIPLIGMYNGTGDGYDRGRYGITIRDNRAYLKDKGFERGIEYPRI